MEAAKREISKLLLVDNTTGSQSGFSVVTKSVVLHITDQIILISFQGDKYLHAMGMSRGGIQIKLFCVFVSQ